MLGLNNSEIVPNGESLESIQETERGHISLRKCKLHEFQGSVGDHSIYLNQSSAYMLIDDQTLHIGHGPQHETTEIEIFEQD